MCDSYFINNTFELNSDHMETIMQIGELPDMKTFYCKIVWKVKSVIDNSGDEYLNDHTIE